MGFRPDRRLWVRRAQAASAPWAGGSGSFKMPWWGGAASYRLEGDRLELRNAEGRTTAAFEEKTRLTFDPAVLAKTRWRLRSVDGAEPVEAPYPPSGSGRGRRLPGRTAARAPAAAPAAGSASGRYAVTAMS